MRILKLYLTARLWQQPCLHLDVFCWQGLLGMAASREVLHLLSSSDRDLANLRREQEPAPGEATSLTAWHAQCASGVKYRLAEAMFESRAVQFASPITGTPGLQELISRVESHWIFSEL